jgi:hypothetical protein
MHFGAKLLKTTGRYWVDVQEDMRTAISQQMSFGDGFIDATLYQLDEELKKVDELLSNEQLLKPFEEVFDESVGRPGTPIGIYLRMMYLKFRWGIELRRSRDRGKRKIFVAPFSPWS